MSLSVGSLLFSLKYVNVDTPLLSLVAPSCQLPNAIINSQKPLWNKSCRKTNGKCIAIPEKWCNLSLKLSHLHETLIVSLEVILVFKSTLMYSVD